MKSRSTPIESDLFSRNRKKLQATLDEDCWAIASSNPLMHRNGDVQFPYRQDSDFYYLTGIEQEGCVLFLSAEEEIFFLPPDDLRNQLWNGRLLDPDLATLLSGIMDIRSLDEMDVFLSQNISMARGLWMDTPGRGALERGGRINGAMMQRKLEQSCPRLVPQALSSKLAPLRMIKEEEEIAAIRRACKITGTAFRRVLATLRPGQTEYGLEAEITAAFISSGSGGHAYEPIIASGSNALVLHYVDNSDICRRGELVLLDFGAEWNNYASDCSRTLPVDGKFSKRQRELYQACKDVFEQARSLMVPGMLLADLQMQVGMLWEEAHIRLGLYSSREARMMETGNPAWRKYFMHGISHSMGLDVHDPFDRERAFEAGMVLTCEPGIYIPEEELGIRLENDILITGDGPVDLMEDIPMDPEEIETLMHELR